MNPRVVAVARWFGAQAARRQVAFVIDDDLERGTWGEQVRQIGGQAPRDAHWSVFSVPAGVDSTRILQEVVS